MKMNLKIMGIALLFALFYVFFLADGGYRGELLIDGAKEYFGGILSRMLDGFLNALVEKFKNLMMDM